MNPLNEHLMTMIEAMLKHEAEEMKTAFEMFNDKRYQVGQLIASVKPLCEDDNEFEDILARCDICKRMIQNTEDSIELIEQTVLLLRRESENIAAPGNVSKAQRETIANKLRERAATLHVHFT